MQILCIFYFCFVYTRAMFYAHSVFLEYLSSLTIKWDWFLVKVIANPAAVSASKVRAITSILVAAISEGERKKKLFLIKTQARGESVISSRHLHCHLVWTACGFHLKTVLVLEEMHPPRPLQPQRSPHQADLPRNSPCNQNDALLMYLPLGHVIKMHNEDKNMQQLHTNK